jgi:hypothetical protein
MTVITMRRMFTHIMLNWRDAFLPQCSMIICFARRQLNPVSERGPCDRPD